MQVLNRTDAIQQNSGLPGCISRFVRQQSVIRFSRFEALVFNGIKKQNFKNLYVKSPAPFRFLQLPVIRYVIICLFYIVVDIFQPLVLAQKMTTPW